MIQWTNISRHGKPFLLRSILFWGPEFEVPRVGYRDKSDKYVSQHDVVSSHRVTHYCYVEAPRD